MNQSEHGSVKKSSAADTSSQAEPGPPAAAHADVTRRARERHLALAGVVKGVHARLRRAVRAADGDHGRVWRHHVADSGLLGQYAEAMRTLAADVWTVNQPHTRIDWCRAACQQWFFREDGLLKQRLKDKKRAYFDKLKTDDGAGVLEDFQWDEGVLGTDHAEVIRLPFEGPIRLLDVGSCYNPFQKFPEFQALGIDISPAINSGVFKCDFLNVQVEPPEYSEQKRAGSLWFEPYIKGHSTEISDSQNIEQLPEISNHVINTGGTTSTVASKEPPSEETSGRGDQSPAESEQSSGETVPLPREIEQLPAASVHVVVFSLLLEYLPVPAQRWVCVRHARDLLMPDGLLLIITPDSHHQNKNAPMMKSWKNAIEGLGFRRWRYEKQDHLHCMAFRKLPDGKETETVGPEMLYIPQDFNTIDDEKSESTNFNETDLMEGFNELPIPEDNP